MLMVFLLACYETSMRYVGYLIFRGQDLYLVTIDDVFIRSRGLLFQAFQPCFVTVVKFKLCENGLLYNLRCIIPREFTNGPRIVDSQQLTGRVDRAMRVMNHVLMTRNSIRGTDRGYELFN